MNGDRRSLILEPSNVFNIDILVIEIAQYVPLY